MTALNKNKFVSLDWLEEMRQQKSLWTFWAWQKFVNRDSLFRNALSLEPFSSREPEILEFLSGTKVQPKSKFTRCWCTLEMFRCPIWIFADSHHLKVWPWGFGRVMLKTPWGMEKHWTPNPNTLKETNTKEKRMRINEVATPRRMFRWDVSMVTSRQKAQDKLPCKRKSDITLQPCDQLHAPSKICIYIRKYIPVLSGFLRG